MANTKIRQLKIRDTIYDLALPNNQLDDLNVGKNNQQLGRRHSATIGSDNFVGLSGFYYSDIVDDGSGNFYLYFTDPHPWDATMSSEEIADTTATLENFFNANKGGEGFGIVVYKRFTNVIFLGSWWEDPDTYIAQFETPDDDQWETCVTKAKEQLASEFSEFNCCIYDTTTPTNGKYFLYSDSLAVGNSNYVVNSWASAFGYANTVDGMFGTAVGRNNTVNYSAFSAGRENVSSGWYSTSFGRGSKALGLSAVAMGEGSTATGPATIALGTGVKATAKLSIAGGHQCTTLGNGSAAFGNFAHTGEDGDSSFSAGYNTFTNGVGATALGHNTKATKVGSFAGGYYTNAFAEYSTAFGASTTADASYSTAFGQNSHASGTHSFAAGEGTTASGAHGATALCWSTTAAGNASFAVGYTNTANGSCSFAAGQNSTVGTETSKTDGTGKCAAVIGYGLTNNEPYSLMIGKYNKTKTGSVFTIGYGANASNPKDLLTVSTTGVVTASRFDGTATKAENDANGNNIENTYVKKTDVIPLANGGTGITPSSLKDLQYKLINALGEGSSAPKDTDFYIAQYAGGGTSDTSYYRRPHSALYSYIKSKTDTLYSPISHTHSSSYAPKSHTSSVATSSAIGHVQAGYGLTVSSTGVLTCRTNSPNMFDWANFVKVREEQYDLDSTTSTRTLKVDGVVVGFVSIEGACILTTHTPGSGSSNNFNYQVVSTLPEAGQGDETHIAYKIYYIPFAGLAS
jgi:hypothetical protein